MAMSADFEWSEVGKRIRARRLAQNRTQQQLAKKAGLTQNGIFRLEAGNTNPQIETLRTVARALGTNTRELVCGISEADPRLADRLAVVRRILESGDDAAIRAMDYGLENAQTVLDRTSGFWDKEPALMRIGGLTYRRSASNANVALKETEDQQSPESRTKSASSLHKLPKISGSLKKEIQAMSGYQLDDAPHLPVGNAGTIALPKSNRHREQHEHPSELTAREDSENASS